MEETLIFRITDNNQFTEEELIAFTNKHSNLILIKEYKSYNPDIGPHYHGWFIGNLSKKTVIYYLKTELHCKGNEDYSLSQKEVKQHESLEGYIRYCCKGSNQDTPPYCFYNIESQVVLENHKNYYLEQDKFKVKMKEKSGKKLDELVKHVKKELQEIYDDQYHQIPLIILDYYKNQYKMISDFQCENLYNYVRGQIEPEYTKQRADRIYARIHRF